MSAERFKGLPAFDIKPHIAVLTDICNEPDDAQSMTRFLLYANEFSIDALIATTSTWQRNSTHKEAIHQIIDAYGSVWENLNSHVPPSRKYPTADALHSVVCSGINAYGMEGARGPLCEGTRLLIQAVDVLHPGDHVWILLWGGASVLAQALLTVQRNRDDRELAEFVAKLRVYAISDQDDAGPWVRLHFPRLFYIASIHGFSMYGLAAWTGISGELHYGFNPGGPDTSLVTKEWLKEHIQIGPYGKESYPDPAFIPEGDTPTFLSLIQNGLTNPLFPEWGGWGGRYILTDPSGESLHYGDAADSVVGTDGRIHVGSQATIWRWREAYQGDFAARMQWTLSPKFQSANHAPVVVLNGDSRLEPLSIKVGSGGTVHLDASKTWDPDSSDEIGFRWIHYAEPSTSRWTVRFAVPTLQITDVSTGARKMEKVEVKIPGNEEGFVSPLDPKKYQKWGPKTYHVVLEVVDSGKYPMRNYRRILIEVVDEDQSDKISYRNRSL